MEGLRDIRSIVDIPTTTPWLGSVVIGAILIGAIIWFYFFKTRSVQEKKDAVGEASQRLAQISPHIDEQPAEAFESISLILRQFLHDHAIAPAMDMTSEELIKHSLVQNEFPRLQELVELDDEVKFAKYSPSVEEVKKNFYLVEEVITRFKDRNNGL